MKLNNEQKDKNILKNTDEISFDISLYDTYKFGVRGGVYDWIENQNNQVPDRSITNPQKTMEQTSEETDDPGSETENGFRRFLE